MTNIVFTERALHEFVVSDQKLSGIVGNTRIVFPGVAAVVMKSATFLIHDRDSVDSRRLMILVPPSKDVAAMLGRNETQALERLLGLFRRAESAKPVLPHQWSLYRVDNFVGFFACSRGASSGGQRWIAELIDRRDVCMWDLYDDFEFVSLDGYERDRDVYKQVLEQWDTAVTQARQRFTSVQNQVQSPLEVDLADPDFGDVTQDLSFDGWMHRLTDSQRAFVLQQPDHSTKLRGPAGSGKTLTLELKAVHEVVEARKRGETTRVLFVTHSWALAGEIDENVARLSDYGPLQEITVLPLLAVAQDTTPAERLDSGLQLIGEDSLSGKYGQLEIITNIVEKFLKGDWLTFRGTASEHLVQRLESPDWPEKRAFVWDCLIEFGCVFGADGIFPGINAEPRYLMLARAPWMMPLESKQDKRVLLYLYNKYISTLISDGQLTSDQLVNDFLNYLETYAWNIRRAAYGYDQIYVDEFHLFNAQERQLLRYMTRSGSEYPRIFMALDPRQSPWEVYSDMSEVAPTSASSRHDEGFGDIASVDLQTVHRFSPQILALVKHVHLEFPNLDLGADWQINFGEVTSLAESGQLPLLVRSGTREAERIEIYDRLRAQTLGRQVAVAIVDQDDFSEYEFIAQGLSRLRMKVNVLTSRDDINTLQYRRRGVVIAPAEFLAGLQFDAVFVAGMPDLTTTTANQGYRRRRYLSLLYLAVTRASRSVQIFVNDENGGVPSVLAAAKKMSLVRVEDGKHV